MNFRKKVIELYEKGVNVEDIGKQIGISIITEESILNWIEEDKIYKEQKENEKRITKLIRENNNNKRRLEDVYSPEKKEKLWKLIIKNLDEILDMEPDNEIAIGEKIKGYIYLHEIDNAEELSKKLLEKNPRNMIALNYLAKIQRSKGNFEKEREYLEKMIELSSEEEQQNATIRLARVNSILEGSKSENNSYEKLLKEGNQISDEEQKKYAEEIENARSFFTREEQEDYINQKYKEFIEGKVQKKQLVEIIEELKKYPEQTTSMLFIVDLYSKMTGKYESSIEKLEQYKVKNKLSENEINSVDEEIKKYSNILNFNESQEQIENEDKIKRDKQVKEQRIYFKFILDRMKKGKIKKDELPEIVEILENYPDKARSIFVITKLYEIVEGRNAALKMLAKYTTLNDLSNYERKIIENMQNTISERAKYENSTTERMKEIYLKKQKKEESKTKSYKRKIQKDTVIKYIEEGKNIEQIEKLLAKNNDVMTITAIRKIRDKYAQENEIVKEKIAQAKVTANELLKAGYKPNQVYNFIGYEISLKEIKQIENEIDDTELSH